MTTAAATWEPELLPGGPMELYGRGTTFVRDSGGAGTPVLLLHGLGANADLNWLPSYRPLVEAGHRVITIDHRGHGRGIRPDDRRFRLADCADDAAAVLDRLGLDHVVAVGYSMGGPISQLLWKRHPPRVAALVECATARYFLSRHRRPVARRTLPGFFTLVRQMPTDRREALRDRLFRQNLDDDPRVGWFRAEGDRNDRDVVLDAARAVSTFSSRTWIGAFAECGKPAVSVITTEDRLVPPHRQRGLAKAIGAQVLDAEANHLDCTLNPDRFVPALMEAVGAAANRL